MRTSAGYVLAILCCWLGGACSADFGATQVDVDILNLDPSVATVFVDATLGERPLTHTLPLLLSSLNHFKLLLQPGDTGPLLLHVSGSKSATDPDPATAGCMVQGGSTLVNVPGPGHYAATIELEAQLGCMLIVSKVGDGEGRVTLSDGTTWIFPRPVNHGTSCPLMQVAPDLQSKAFPLRTTVGLSAAVDAKTMLGSYFGGWGQGCQGSGGCEVQIGSDSRLVEVSFLPTQVCSASNFCWEQPRPQGSNLRRLAGTAADDIWAVGEGGTVLHWDSVYWLSPHRPQLNVALNGIYIPTPGNVWVVGDQGTVMHLASSVWGCPTQLTPANLNDVWGSGGDDIWTVGNQAAIYHWEGAKWTPVPAPAGVTGSLLAIAGWTASDVWAVGTGGTVLHYNGTTWLPVGCPGCADWHAVWPSGPAEAWVVGANGLSAHLTGTQVQLYPLGSASTLNAVWGSGPDDIWVGGQMGMIFNYNARNGWALADGGIRADLMAIWGSGISQVWAAGTDGTLSYFNGVSWLPRTTALSTGTFNAVWGAPAPNGQAGPIWAVGDQGVGLRWSGADWVVEGQLGKQLPGNLRAVWGSSGTDVWFVGDQGRAYHLLANVSSAPATGTVKDLLAIWGSGAADVLTVGAGGTLAHYDGTQFATQILPAAAGNSLRAVWGAAPNKVWIAGDAGTLLSWDGSTATPVPSGVTGSLRALWGSGLADVWAVGDAGVILHYDGLSWRADSQSGQLTTATLLSIWGRTAIDVWAVAALGGLLHWDGKSWSRVDSEFAKSLNGVWGSATQGVIAVGQAGTILRFRD